MSRPAAGKRSFWAWGVATFFGAGFLKPGPGTWASAAAAILWILSGQGLRLPVQRFGWLTLAAAAAAAAVGIPAATRVARESGRKDPGYVVIDEVVGQWIALIHSPANLNHLLAAFLLFRLFDIVKPWPARRWEGFPGGWGIMLDDVAAGVYALLVVQVFTHWIG